MIKITKQGSSDWVTTNILFRVKDSFMHLTGQTGVIRSVTEAALGLFIVQHQLRSPGTCHSHQKQQGFRKESPVDATDVEIAVGDGGPESSLSNELEETLKIRKGTSQNSRPYQETLPPLLKTRGRKIL